MGGRQTNLYNGIEQRRGRCYQGIVWADRCSWVNGKFRRHQDVLISAVCQQANRVNFTVE
ncbi:hypothetical protein ABMA09_10535 [Erwinia rhapontici]